MLEAIRKRAGSLVVKLLFALLVLSFVVWGVADVFRPHGGGDWAAKVGDTTIATSTFQEEYRRTLERVGRSMGRPLDPQQAQALGVPTSVLQQLVDGVLLDKAAVDMGLLIDDAAVRAEIKANPQFRNQAGQFDEQVFRSLLASNGLTEERFVTLIRRELQREQLVGTLAGGVVAPAAMVDAIEAWRAERRVAEWVKFTDGAMPVPAEPDEPTLRQFHQDYPGLFTAPEYRALTVLLLNTDAVAKDIVIDDAALQAAYQERLAEFTVPERRAFRQLVFTDAAAAAGAQAGLAAGGSFAAAATAAGQSAADTSVIGPVTQAQLPPELAVVFTRGRGEVGAPVQSPLGWHVLEVTEIVPGSVQSFGDAKARLTEELKREKAVDALVGLGDTLEDTLGRGATLTEAAAELGLPVRAIAAVDARGRDPAGAEVSGLPAGLLDKAFETAAQSDSGLVEADRDSYYVVRVESVTPSAVKPFETLRTAVADAWRARQRNDKARAEADALAERARTRGTLAAAGEKGPKPETTPPFTRAGEGAPDGFPRTLQAALFAAKAGEVVVVSVDDGWAVARLVSITPPSPEALKAGEAAVRSELVEQLRSDLLAQYAAALRSRWAVKINPRVLDQTS